MINIPGLNGPDQSRLKELEIGRSHFGSFSFMSNGRTLTAWIFDPEGLRAIEAAGLRDPSPEAIEPAEPAAPAKPAVPAVPAQPEPPQPAVRLVPIRTGAREATPVTPVPLNPGGLQ